MAFIAPALPFIAAGLAAVGTAVSVSGAMSAKSAAGKQAALAGAQIELAKEQAEVSATSALEVAAAKAAAATARAGTLEKNQRLAEQAAADAEARGDISVAQQARRTVQFIGRQRVALAAQGQIVDQGSGLDLTSDTAALGKLDELTLLANAEREALGFRTQALNFAAAAALEKQTAVAVLREGELLAEAVRIGGEAGVFQAQAGVLQAKTEGTAALFAAGQSLITGASTIATAFGNIK